MKEKAKLVGGIRISRLNIILIAVALIIALLMVLSMYQTTDRFNEIVDVTDDYLTSQSAAGMLSDLSASLAEQSLAFVNTGSPDLAQAWAGQYAAISAQLDAYHREIGESSPDAFMGTAIRVFRLNAATELRAMRLAAEDLPMWPDAFPELIRTAELTEEEASLSPEAKKAAARALLTSEEFQRNQDLIVSSVDDSHRMSSEQGQIRAARTAQEVHAIISRQKLLIFFFVVFAFVALLLNQILIIRPVQQGVEKLDKQERLPIRGSYEMRHLSKVYNDVLEDNAHKTEALSYTASHDALTGLHNRASFDKAYKTYQNDTVGIVLVDIDHFKSFNDDYGHDTGDRVLRLVADNLRSHFRTEDHISRIGGDEFCVIMPNTCQSQADIIIDKIRKINRELASHPEENENLPPVSISAGIAFWDRSNPKSTLLKDADSMLLALKHSRSDCVAVYPG